MKTFAGKGVYGAIAIGKIAVFRRQDIPVKREMRNDPETELNRLEEAKGRAIAQLGELYHRAVEEVGEDHARIFEVHRMLVEDAGYNEVIAGMIRGQQVSAEYAVTAAAGHFSKMFEAMDDGYMQARAADIRDISNRIIACLSHGGADTRISGEKVILCADDLAPSETVTLDKEKVLAFVTAHGSSSSHTAILAENRNIPAIIGVGEQFLGEVKDGDLAIADGFSGTLIVQPDEKTVREYADKMRREMEKKEAFEKLKGKENITLDGTKIGICANIGSMEDVKAALANDAGGVGLFRSEFMYLGQKDYPTEDMQYAVYKNVLERMGSRRVIIRTLDMGADKQADYFRLDKEENPALGLRGIRLCLARPELLKTQLRALYRASVSGRLGILFPMIAHVWELSQVLAMCEEVKKELAAEKLPFSREVELGVMIETPAAALISDQLAPLVDFFSVGTNDLIQYTLACDRQNPNMERFCDPHHEAVLELLRVAVRNAHAHGKWIGICGELAADTAMTETFLRMGIDELSVAPPLVLKVRDAVRGVDLKK